MAKISMYTMPSILLNFFFTQGLGILSPNLYTFPSSWSLISLNVLVLKRQYIIHILK